MITRWYAKKSQHQNWLNLSHDPWESLFFTLLMQEDNVVGGGVGLRRGAIQVRGTRFRTQISNPNLSLTCKQPDGRRDE